MEEKTFSIPTMDQAEIAKWYQSISPIISIGGKPRYLRRLSDSELSKIAYTWLDNKKDYEDCVDYTKLEKLSEQKMLHTYGYHGFFKPSVDEIIRQIPKELLPQTVAFEIIQQPNDQTDLKFVTKALSSGFHVSTVRLYKAK